MDSQAVKDTFTQAKADDEAGQRKRLAYMITGAMEQKRAKEDVLRCVEKERRQVMEEISTIEDALVDAEAGDDESLNVWFARRQSDNCCGTPMGLSQAHQAERRPTVEIGIHG